MKYEKIGNISEGIDGTDGYVLVKRDQEELEAGLQIDTEMVVEYLASMFFRIGGTAGSQYCTTITATPHPWLDQHFIGYVQFRYDI